MILLDTRGPADSVAITQAVQTAISYQVSVTMVEAWDPARPRYATMALVQGQPGCQDALQELLRGSRNVLIGARVCRALPYIHA
eukprot:3106417-Heterocapsa_arctica.AAC.1